MSSNAAWFAIVLLCGFMGSLKAEGFQNGPNSSCENICRPCMIEQNDCHPRCLDNCKNHLCNDHGVSCHDCCDRSIVQQSHELKYVVL